MSIKTGCRAFILEAQNQERFIDGSLSLQYGFMSQKPLLDKLSDRFHIWDTLVSRVPGLYYQNKSQHLIEALPLLDANHLHATELPRAATILSILASAYWRHGLEKIFEIRNTIEDGSLPASLLEPWTIVCERLGRGTQPYQSCNDLFLKNFSLKENRSYTLENIKIENIEVLVKSFGNEAERVFYMSFVEIHAVTSSIVNDICDLEDILNRETLEKGEQYRKLSFLLQKIAASVKESVKSLLKISPVRKSKTYCDPILWSKSVGVFAIPPANFIQGGTSGTSTPVVHVIDALLGRKKYASYYGQYIKKEGEPLLPLIIKEFVKRVAGLDLRSWIESRREESEYYYELVDSYNQLVNAYAGNEGFLDKHTSKVFNYLGIATMVGRNQSTSGHQRYIKQETWKYVTQELKIAQEERTSIELQNIAKVPASLMKEEKTGDDLPTISYLEVARRFKREEAWIVLEGYVYDVTNYLPKHPGGLEIIRPYLGRDATQEFSMIPGHCKGAVTRILQSLKIGVFDPELSNKKLEKYQAVLRHLLKVYGLLDIQIAHDIYGYDKFLYLSQVHNQFCKDSLNSLLPISFEEQTNFYELNLFCLKFGSESIYKSLSLSINELLKLAEEVVSEDLMFVEFLIRKLVDYCSGSEDDIDIFYNEAHNYLHNWNETVEGIVQKLNLQLERHTMSLI